MTGPFTQRRLFLFPSGKLKTTGGRDSFEPVRARENTNGHQLENRVD